MIEKKQVKEAKEKKDCEEKQFENIFIYHISISNIFMS